MLRSGPLSTRPGFAWAAILLGQALSVFSLAALSGPGRIDIVDGQTRYEVARSLVEHGDSVIRDPRVEFDVLLGRDGQRFTRYRFPQSVAGAAAIIFADATGPAEEGRRHFFFTLTSAAAVALLALSYTIWFRFLGHGPWAAVGWSFLGVVCTPNWYYATTTFDDILGAAAVVPAVVLAFLSRQRRPWAGAAAAGLLLGLAFNVKPPLGIFVLPVVAAAWDHGRPLRPQLGLAALILTGLAFGVAARYVYDRCKFPSGLQVTPAVLEAMYGPIWGEQPLVNLAALVLSLGAGMVWYCPPVLLSLYGPADWGRSDRSLYRSVLASSLTFLLFIAHLSFFKGDPAWGPRYLTPVYALLWLFAPASTARVSRVLLIVLLAAGCLVQLLALSVDPHRRYIHLGLPSAFGMFHPEGYFHLDIAHLPSRPHEIMEIWCRASEPVEFTPAPEPTFTVPVIDAMYRAVGGSGAKPADVGPVIVHRYWVFDSFRPWWISQRALPPAERPVPLGPTVALLLGMLVGGGVLVMTGCRSVGAARPPPTAGHLTSRGA